MGQVESLFVVTVEPGGGDGDGSIPILVTREFAEALGVLKRLDELGYKRKLCKNTHGVIIYGMDLDRPYKRAEYSYITGLPVVYKSFPPMLLLIWSPEKTDFRVEWFPTAFQRMGVVLPPELLAGAVSLEG